MILTFSISTNFSIDLAVNSSKKSLVKVVNYIIARGKDYSLYKIFNS